MESSLLALSITSLLTALPFGISSILGLKSHRVLIVFQNFQFERGFLSELEYLRQRIFHFTKENIAKLKAKANVEIGSTNKISSLQAIFSQIWLLFTCNQSFDPDEEVLFVSGIEVRQRLQPPLPPEYFGNATQGEFVSLKARDQLEQGLGNVALKMNKFIAACTGEKIKNFLESWGNPLEIRTWDSLLIKNNTCLVSSSPRFNFYGNDFGWGRLMAVRSGLANKANRKITLFAEVEEGSVDVKACFLPETLQSMGNDTEFMQLVS